MIERTSRVPMEFEIQEQYTAFTAIDQSRSEMRPKSSKAVSGWLLHFFIDTDLISAIDCHQPMLLS